MTTKPKTRKAPAAKASTVSDPIFAAIAEHKALEKELIRVGRVLARTPLRMTGTEPVTLADAAALVNYARRNISGSLSDVAAWQVAALEVVAELAREIARLVKLQPAPTNPKLIALAAKLDAEKAQARVMEARQKGADDIDAAEEACAAAYCKISALAFKLAKTTATNLEELALKARFAEVTSYDQKDWPGTGSQAAAASIIRDLLALDANPRPQPQ
jgi:hypothetical protein